MVAILFARQDSIYKTLPGVEVYDKERNAHTFQGGCPVVAHPPCRGWGRLRAFAKPEPGELDLAIWAIDQVRKWGGYWSTQNQAYFGGGWTFQKANRLTNLAASPFPSTNLGLGTVQEKGLGCMCAASNPLRSRQCRSNLMRLHT